MDEGRRSRPSREVDLSNLSPEEELQMLRERGYTLPRPEGPPPEQRDLGKRVADLEKRVEHLERVLGQGGGR